MKFRTIDIEGDGNTTVNKRLFPKGNHFDPDTIMWVVTFCDQDYNTLTLESSRVPKEIDGHKVVEFTEWSEYLKEIVWQIMISDGNVYSKAYGLYNFDSQVLKANLERNNMYDGVSRFIKSINVPGYLWKETHKQVTVPGTPNERFMVTGIRHNMEDSIQLAEIINRMYSGK